MRIALLLTLSCWSLFGFGQTNQIQINRYHLPTSSPQAQSVVLQMDFAQAQVQAVTGDTLGLQAATDVWIDIVCTDFPAYASLSQLNQQRLQACMQRFPTLRLATIQQVNIIRQMDGKEKAEAMPLFHGVVLHFRPTQTAALMQQDLSKLEELLSTHLPTPTAIDTPIQPIAPTTSTPNLDEPETDVLILPNVYHRVKELPRNVIYLKHVDSVRVISTKDAIKESYIDKKTAKERYRYNDSVTIVWGNLWGRDRSKDVYESILLKDTLDKTKPITALPDSTILQIFKRNHWTNTAITVDVTASMYPYSAQLLLLLQQFSLDSISHQYTFFNDGDDMPNQQKKMGATGGVYSERCNNYSEVKQLLKRTMQLGSGGDCAENDVEALLQSEQQFTGIQSHLLIADNRAPVKDLTLAKQLHKPVHVLLCGVWNGAVNLDYVNLAYQTKGSVHLIEEDLINLTNLKEADHFTIGSLHCTIKNGIIISDPN